MSSPESSSLPPREAIPPAYWLGVCNGLEAAEAWVEGHLDLDVLFKKYPILFLPEFPDAIGALPMINHRLDKASDCFVGAAVLRGIMAQKERTDPLVLAWLRNSCAISLVQEFRGSPRVNIVRSIQLFASVRWVFPRSSTDFAMAEMNEGNARVQLAALGVDSRENLERAGSLYKSSQRVFVENTHSFGRAQMNEGSALVSLAELGVQPRENLDRAVGLYESSRCTFSPMEPDFGLALMNEGNARRHLAELMVEPKANLERALCLYNSASDVFVANDSLLALVQMNETNARLRLAEMGEDLLTNLDQAKRLSQASRRVFSTGSPNFCFALVNEGIARLRLAELGVDPETNLTEAASLQREGGDQFVRLGHYRDGMKAFANCAESERARAEELRTSTTEAWQRCRDAWTKAAEMLEAVRSQTGGQQERRAWLDRNAGVYQGAVEASLELGDFEGALEFAERGRGRTLIDLLNLRENRPRNIDDAAWSDYVEIIRRLESMERISATSASSGEETPTVDRMPLLETIAAHERKFREADPEYFAAAQPPGIEAIRDVARRLDRTVVLPWVGERRSSAFLVEPNGAVKSVDLPGLTRRTVFEWMIGPEDAASWIRTYLRFRGAHAKRMPNEIRGQTRRDWFATMTKVLGEADRLVVEPIDRALGRGDDVKPIALVTGGLLGMLPLHAARPAEADSAQCWLDRVEIIHGPSIAVLGRCHERSRDAWSPVLGAIDPSQDLWESHWEAEELRKRVIDRGGEFTHLVHDEVTRKAVRPLLASHGLLHFACHGTWHPNEPLESGIVMADGLIKLRELISERSCERARLVTLSACESGLGHEVGQSGEDYLGLPAGFLLGGAKAVVGSLWSVSDRVTAVFMDAFYRRLFEGKSLPASLREAQIELRGLSKQEARRRLRAWGASADKEEEEKSRGGPAGSDESPNYDHPFYWAGFTVHGAETPVI